ncbi:hypothetical protein SAMN02745751_01675 [Dethiosulfatibacter aminovorans DSM 17477]|uniref:Phosphatidylglycerol lysyltransferase n=1 Tax=Dethiosulfatibacter aminovorans DSM 17477 TaxID=1121476 RepID=A0A1M6GAX8_9FIRM|nr:lysylphosphatidylglycerol synthase transmembrane domain-containing protein [Dethiosulfatibacter aminovorans]SHJ07076.1 hypothetical protein SAMN02745751_01675 [Dethiosulfatibacter aminovorans DSM 17477]
MKKGTSENLNVKRRYFLLLLLFGLLSGLSLLGVYHFAGNRVAFLSLDIFSRCLYLRLFLLILFYFATDFLRFYYIMKAIDVDISLSYMMKVTFINIFISNITPSSAGGGVAQIYFLQKKGVNLGAATAGSSLRTALPMLFFIICTPIILIFDKNIERLFPNRNIIVYMIIMMLLIVCVLIFLLKLIRNPSDVGESVKRLILFFAKRWDQEKRERITNNAGTEIRKFSSYLISYFRGNKKYVFLSIFFSGLFLYCLFLFPVVLIKDLNSSVPAYEIIFSQIIITSVMYFSPTPGATGIAEAAFTILFSAYILPEQIVTLTFLWRFSSIYIGVFIGVVIFYRETIKIKDWKKVTR